MATSRLQTGQITLTGSAQQLTTAVLESKTFCIKAFPTNAGLMFWGVEGVTTTTGHVLAAGEEYKFEYLVVAGQPVFDLQPQHIYVVGATAGDRVSWASAGR